MKLRATKSMLLLPFIVIATVLTACDRSADSSSDHGQSAQKQGWATVVHSHSGGTISKNSPIRLRFVRDVVSEEKIGSSAEGVLRFTPTIAGKISFVNQREILLVPSASLESGKHYQARLDHAKLMNIPAGLDDYQFDFNVIEQNFEVNIIGLSNDPQNDKKLILRGSLTTADAEDTGKVEQVLSASYLGQALNISWEHNTDGRHHEFLAAGIERQSDSHAIRLVWNGDKISVANRGEREVNVSALGQFSVSRVHAVQDDRQYVQIEFTDALNTRQNLKGLVRLGEGEFQTRIDGNLIKVYPSKPLTGVVAVSIEPGIKNTKGQRLSKRMEYSVGFTREKPRVRFVGKGEILPQNQQLTIPFEAINVASVQVTAYRVFDENIGQFLQYNNLDGQSGLQRVGQYLWRKTITLKSPTAESWNRYALDATELLSKHQGSLYRLTLSINRSNSTFSCRPDDNAVAVLKERPLTNNVDISTAEVIDKSESTDEYDKRRRDLNWQDRNNPCNDAYFTYNNVSASRNFIVSNMGLLAKRGADNKLHVVATDLRTATPLPGVKLTFMNYQNQPIGDLKTDNKGMAVVSLSSTPFYLLATKGKQKGYLKLAQGNVLSTSHFDVGGEKLKQGIKAHIYAERGVWRPGDDIFLTFVLQDKANVIPEKHPVMMQLYNPKGQLMQSITNNQPVGDFYAFKLKTREDDLTGNWTAKAILGGSTFSKTLKIETVVPNRLKVDLDFGTETLYQADMPVSTSLFGQWLHGATAKGLKADIAVTLQPVKTQFPKYSDYVFDDPAREFRSRRDIIFEGKLDESGKAEFKTHLKPGSAAPGMMRAQFNSRIFEQGGAFSTSNQSIKYSPYENYVGIHPPKGDKSYGTLKINTQHTLDIASVDSHGKTVSMKKVQVTMYNIGWRWWWDNSGDSLAQYISASNHRKYKQGMVETVDGHGSWQFKVGENDYGRYLIRACDLEGKHCSGKVVYVGWAWGDDNDSGPGASALNFFADKTRYKVGETAKIQLPEATQGRALISIETGSQILQQRWIEFDKGKANFDLPLTQAMSPNVYVSVTLIQPHQGKNNDRPIRLYGIIPIMVDDPTTHLEPLLTAADEWAPKSQVEFKVAEQQGRSMTYTVAVVDEGLLGLTRYRTPDLHKRFYKKEALGVVTWDLFDDVTGAYGGELERLLALGGSDDEEDAEQGEKQKRFPPVIRFLGPFQLQAGETATHKIDLPQYVGAVRVMLVAGEQGAYGEAHKSVFVREDLSMLATVPRVLGPEEDLLLPVSLFVMKDNIRNVSLTLEVDEYFEILGNKTVEVKFDEPGEQLGFLHIKVKSRLGKGHLRFIAEGGKARTQTDVYIDVRSANPRTLRQKHKVLQPGEMWQEMIKPHGLPGTNVVTLEMSAIPPINLERRLQYLIHYPHGCVEQTTSSVLPQLSLAKFIKLDKQQKENIDRNINAAIDRLRSFQHSNGGFRYWPGSYDQPHAWGTNYAGHFLVAASQRGYQVPSDMMSAWQGFQQQSARNWVAGSGQSELDQAYRLYTLALAGKAELGAMNRLRESGSLQTTSRWQLAAAYKLAGLGDVARQMVQGASHDVGTSIERHTFGSRLRNQAILLNSLVLLELHADARELAENISDELSADKWHSTQTVAYSLLAMSRFIGEGDASEAFSFEQAVGKGTKTQFESNSPIFSHKLEGFPAQGETLQVHNTSARILYASVLVQGIPKSGEERAERKGLALKVIYRDLQGYVLSEDKLPQGKDFIAEVSVHNLRQRALDNVALSHVLPSGWEIHNSRMQGGETLKNDAMDFQDIRDDRLYTYFGLKPGEKKTFRVMLNATYQGKYYLPSVSVEAMYDATKTARIKGKWVEVVAEKPAQASLQN